MPSKSKRVCAPAQTSTPSLVHESTLPDIIRWIFAQAIKEVVFQGVPCLFQYWKCSSPQGSEANGFNVTVVGQHFLLPRYNSNNVELGQYRESCEKLKGQVVRQNTNVQTWLAGRAVQTRVADQGTRLVNGSNHQKLGLLVLPVFLDRGTHKGLVGIIEVVTLVAKESYAEDFVKIHNLMKHKGLESEGLAKTVKVGYKGNTIKFTLSFTAKLQDLEKELKKRRIEIKNKTFSIKYKDTNDKDLPLLNNNDLRVCINESVSKETTVIKMFVELVA